jgi:predicted outer membrane protein
MVRESARPTPQDFDPADVILKIARHKSARKSEDRLRAPDAINRSRFLAARRWQFWWQLDRQILAKRGVARLIAIVPSN